MGAEHETTIYTDHKNLMYYQDPHQLSGRVARYISKLAEYNFKLVHKLGATNHTNHLSQRLGWKYKQQDDDKMIVLLDHLFVHMLSLRSIEQRVLNAQERSTMKINQ